MSAPERLPDDETFEPYKVLDARRRLLLVLLAVATAVTVFWLLLYRPGAPKTVRHAAPCIEDAATRCPGGTTDVILLPTPASAPTSH